MGRLSDRNAARLARLAEQHRPDGTRGMVARWALRTLVEAADRGEQAAAEALWQVWLGHPENGLWQRLTGWLHQAVLAEQALEAAVEPARPAASRQAIGAFCTHHGILPDGPLQQTVFHLLAGQTEQHRALDPDGSLLADAYRAASGETREALRQAMVGSGDLDMVRVVVGDRRDRGADLTAAEAGDLARHLAAGGRWEELWRLALEVPIVLAVSIVGLFRGWEPDGEEARRLFRRLADPRARLAATRLEPTIRHVRINPPSHFPRLSVAPDGSRVAVLCAEHLLERGPLLQVYELPGGTLAWSRELVGMQPSSHHVLQLDGVVVVTDDHWAGHFRRFLKVSDGGQELTYSCPYASQDELVRLPDGFVATALDRIVLGSATGEVTRTLPLSDLSVHATGRGHRLASWPRAGRFAIGGRRLALADQDARLVAVSSRATDVSSVAFTGPDTLVTSERATDEHVSLTCWTRDGDELVPARSTTRRTAAWRPALAVIPALGRIIMSGPDLVAGLWLEQDTLAPAEPPVGFRDVPAHSLEWQGGWVAVHRRPGLDLYRFAPAPELLEPMTRPMGTMRPGELASVASAEQEVGDPDHRLLLGLVRACLEHRFATEVEIAPGWPVLPGEHDIRIE